MTAALAHRGPDDDGFHYDGPVGLGFRRLSVIDIAGSHQPLVSADGAIAVVFNGEIYNFRALRRELAQAGHAFVTQGDGGLVHGWKAWGRALLDRLSACSRSRSGTATGVSSFSRAIISSQAALLRVAQRALAFGSS
jgi:asparagine synthase (glutamine-hydrolysing)